MKWTVTCILCTHQKSYKLDAGIMLIFVSEKNRPLLLAKGVCHPDDIRSFPMSSGWHNVSWSLCHPDEIAPSRISCGWLWPMQDVIRMTYDAALCHPDEITKIWSLSHPDDLAIPSIPSGWLIVDTSCHQDDLPGVGISSGWVTANSLCHPDDILFHFMSFGWLNRPVSQ